MNLPGAHWAVAFMLSFDIPLFTFLSGFVLFGREGASRLRFVRRKALGLLLPYFAWVAIATVQRHVPPNMWTSRMLGSAINPHLGFQMWFLWVLFVLFAIFALARAVNGSDAWLVGLAVASGAALYLPLPTTFGADKIAWLFPFLVLGYLCGKHRDALRRYDRLYALIGVAAFSSLTWLQLGGVVPRFGTAVAGIATAWALFRLLPEPLTSAVAWAGQKTLGIYGGQMILLPYLLVGAGWFGAVASEATILVGATALAWLLGLNAVTRGVFLGQWRTSRGAATVPVLSARSVERPDR
jgi:fucose 4-O-acetylase-like acetyltransferase